MTVLFSMYAVCVSIEKTISISFHVMLHYIITYLVGVHWSVITFSSFIICAF